jgi:hypothetical protein
MDYLIAYNIITGVDFIIAIGIQNRYKSSSDNGAMEKYWKCNVTL